MMLVILSVLVCVVGAVQTEDIAAVVLVPLVMMAGHVSAWREWGLNRRAIEGLLCSNGEPG